MKKLPFLNEDEQKETQELNGKWIAILMKGKRTGDPEIIRDNGQILADENPIIVQAKIMELYPELAANNERGWKIRYCYLPNKLALE